MTNTSHKLQVTKKTLFEPPPLEDHLNEEQTASSDGGTAGQQRPSLLQTGQKHHDSDSDSTDGGEDNDDNYRDDDDNDRDNDDGD